MCAYFVVKRDLYGFIGKSAQKKQGVCVPVKLTSIEVEIDHFFEKEWAKLLHPALLRLNSSAQLEEFVK